MQKAQISIVLALGLVTACGGSAADVQATQVPSPPSSAAAAVDPSTQAIAPRPFTADQIRDAMPKGQVLRFRMEGAGAAATVEEWTVVAADAEGMTLASKVFAEDGALLRDEGEARSTWIELRDHATFPAAATTRTEGELDTPLGRLATWTYEVSKPGDDGVPVVSTFVFAKTLPGPPVLLTVTRQGQVVRRMTLLARK